MKRFALAFLLLSCFAAPASAWWKRGYAPACDEPMVLARIVEKFSYADRRTFHWGVAIAQISSIYERAPVVTARHSLIARRWCQATATLTNGQHSPIIYLVEAQQGFASMGYNVESCLPGFDPWHVYDGWCRAIAP
jgi:hypothetical protein